VEAVAALAAKVNAALDAVRQAEHEIVAAGRDLMRQVGAAAAMAGDRRGRTSAASHVARLLERGGEVNLEKFQRDLDERPHLFGATLRARYRIEQEKIIDGWWRNGQPAAEDVLVREAAGYSGDDAAAISAELTRSGRNGFHLAALAFQRVGASRPDLFGRLTWQEEAREIEEANTLVTTASAVICSSPVLLSALCEIYAVEQRPGVNPLPSLIDAALSEHQRGGR
jgi:hypothetical protein